VVLVTVAVWETRSFASGAVPEKIAEGGHPK
jgi:hypothetical protein